MCFGHNVSARQVRRIIFRNEARDRQLMKVSTWGRDTFFLVKFLLILREARGRFEILKRRNDIKIYANVLHLFVGKVYYCFSAVSELFMKESVSAK
jgi:hypothetical protein